MSRAPRCWAAVSARSRPGQRRDVRDVIHPTGTHANEWGYRQRADATRERGASASVVGESVARASASVVGESVGARERLRAPRADLAGTAARRRGSKAEVADSNDHRRSATSWSLAPTRLHLAAEHRQSVRTTCREAHRNRHRVPTTMRACHSSNVTPLVPNEGYVRNDNGLPKQTR